MKLLFILFSCILLSLYSVYSQKLTVHGKSLIQDNNHNNKFITLRKDTVIIEVIEKDKSFSFDLDFDNQYTVTFSKEGHITKTVLINTMFVPEHYKNTNFNMEFDIELPLQPKDSTVVYPQPVGVIGFDKKFDDFGYKTNYNTIVINKD